MPTLDAKQTYKNLKKKGFEDSPNRSEDHKYLEFRHNGKVVLYTKISHGEKELGDSLIGQMKRQCKLEKSDFMGRDVTVDFSSLAYGNPRRFVPLLWQPRGCPA